MQIIIKQKDLIKRQNKRETTKEKYPLVGFSDNDMLIDELAYSANQWTSNELWENNMDYEPTEPYGFNFEEDLFKNTKTIEQLIELSTDLDVGATVSPSGIKEKLQAGAYMALNNPSQWSELLEAYTNAVKDQEQAINSKIYSKDYEKELQDARDSYNDNQYSEWLNGDYRDYAGVIKEIGRYYGAEDQSYDKKLDVFTFEFDNDELKETLEAYYGSKDIRKAKKYILTMIYDSSIARYNKEKLQSAERAQKREIEKEYKAKRKAEDEAERVAKLKKMTL